MKVSKINDINKFFEVVDSCKGKVELVTGEGDRLNLKSKLCQYVSLATIFSSEADIPDLEIIAFENVGQLLNCPFFYISELFTFQEMIREMLL